MSESRLPAIAALLFAIFAWSITPSLVRSFAIAVGPGESVVIRMVSVAIIALPMLLISGWQIDRKDWPMFLLLGLVGMFGYFIGSIYGFAKVSAGVGGMLYATQPLLIAGLAAAIGAERLSLPVIAGMVISFAGTIYLFAEGLGGTSSDLIWGALLLFFAGAAWAIYVVYSKPMIKKYGASKVTLWSLVLCVLPSLAFATSATLTTVQNLSGAAWASLAFLSLVGTLLSVNFWNYAASRLNPTTMGASLYIIPPCIAAFGWLFLGETTSATTWIAGAIILVGVGVAEFGKNFITET
jgi:drug/metabolite transporter (DMT)-like permease